MTSQSLAFAVPGDLDTLTGGYIYDRQVVDGLRARGWSVQHVELGESFPAPSAADIADAAKRLAIVPANTPLMIDGLAMGALDDAVLDAIAAPIIALVHHPLAHESGLTEARRRELHRQEKANLAYAVEIIVTSPHTSELLIRDYGVDSARITVAQPGTHAVQTTTSRREPPLILSVGIQAPRKGHDVLLRALAALTDLQWQAVIVGEARDAEHARDLKAMAADPILTGRVHFAGRVAQEDLVSLYAEAQVFALATRYEGYGIVFNEAMTHGLPIVSCAVGAVPDTVAWNAGLLVAPDDPQAFAAALRQVLEDEALRERMAAASARAGADLGDWAETVRTVEAVLSRVRG